MKQARYEQNSNDTGRETLCYVIDMTSYFGYLWHLACIHDILSVTYIDDKTCLLAMYCKLTWAVLGTTSLFSLTVARTCHIHSCTWRWTAPHAWLGQLNGYSGERGWRCFLFQLHKHGHPAPEVFEGYMSPKSCQCYVSQELSCTMYFFYHEWSLVCTCTCTWTYKIHILLWLLVTLNCGIYICMTTLLAIYETIKTGIRICTKSTFHYDSFNYNLFIVIIQCVFRCKCFIPQITFTWRMFMYVLPKRMKWLRDCNLICLHISTCRPMVRMLWSSFQIVRCASI